MRASWRPPDRTGEVWALHGVLHLVTGAPVKPWPESTVWRHPVFCLEPDDDEEWRLTHAHEVEEGKWTSGESSRVKHDA